MIMNDNRSNPGLKKLYKYLFFILLFVIALNCLILAFEMKNKGYLDRTDYGAAIFFVLLPSFFFYRLRWLEKRGLTIERLDQPEGFKEYKDLILGKSSYLALLIIITILLIYMLIKIMNSI